MKRRAIPLPHADSACAKDAISATNIDDHFQISALPLQFSVSAFRFHLPERICVFVRMGKTISMGSEVIGRSMATAKHRLFKRIVPWLTSGPDMYSRIYVVRELLGSRYSIFLLIGSLFITVSTVNSRALCRNATETVLLNFVPCALNELSSVSMPTATTREILDRCDLLVQAAMHLAVERINQSPDVLANTILHVHKASAVQPLDFTQVSIIIIAHYIIYDHNIMHVVCT